MAMENYEEKILFEYIIRILKVDKLSSRRLEYIADLDVIDDTPTIDRLLGEKNILKKNLENFKFQNEIGKWNDVFNELEDTF